MLADIDLALCGDVWMAYDSCSSLDIPSSVLMLFAPTAVPGDPTVPTIATAEEPVSVNDNEPLLDISI